MAIAQLGILTTERRAAKVCACVCACVCVTHITINHDHHYYSEDHDYHDHHDYDYRFFLSNPCTTHNLNPHFYRTMSWSRSPDSLIGPYCWLVSVKLNQGYNKVPAPGKPGDKFRMGACVDNAMCGSRFGLKRQTVRNQRGEIVAFGNCCSGTNTIGSAGSHSYGRHAECAQMECTADNKECTYTGPYK